MARINLFGQAVGGRSPHVSAQVRENLYAEILPGIGDKNSAVLYGLPGHEFFIKPTSLPVLWLRWDGFSGRGYYAAMGDGTTDTNLYLQDNDTAYDLGMIATVPVNTVVSAWCQETKELLVVPLRQDFDYNLVWSSVDGGALVGITFPGPSFSEATAIEFAGSRFVMNSPLGAGRVYYSKQLDGQDWTGEYFTAQGVGHIKRFFWLRDTLVVFGNLGTAFYVETADPNLPYQPISGTFGGFSLAHTGSLAVLGDTVYFAARVRGGGVTFGRLNGYSFEPINTYDVDSYFRTVVDGAEVDDPIYRSGAFTWKGHGFYWVTFHHSQRTFIYDATTDLWSEMVGANLCSTIGQDNLDAQDSTILAGLVEGSIVRLSERAYTYRCLGVNNPITYRAILPHLFDPDGLSLTVVPKVRLDIDPNGPAPTLSISRDGGTTYGTAMTGAATSDGKMLQWSALGQARDWVMKFEATGSTGPVAWIGAYADARAGGK